MRIKQRQRREKQKKLEQQLQFDFVEELKHLSLATSLEINKKTLKELFVECSDIVIRDFKLKDGIAALAVFVDGLVETELQNETLKSLMLLGSGSSTSQEMLEQMLPVSQVQDCATYDKLLLAVLSGDTAILMDGDDSGLLLGIRGAQLRSVSEPETESVVRGPREGFIENIRTNTSLIRRRLKTPHLKMTSLTLGKQSNTNIVIAYMDNIANPSTVEEVIKRVQNINIDVILESGTVEQLIEDSVYSPFPQVQYTERPDTVVASLVEGRIAIIIDGTPFVLLVPTTFWMLMQASEDYYERMPIGTLVRWIRYTFLAISLLTPAFYVAVTTFHIDLVPTTLLLSIAASREAIPFPAVVETLLMEITFEALREAGVRLPKAIGQTVSILGALVVGSAAVEAGIVSAPIVIVVSITGIASFTIPRFNGAIAIRMLRFPLIIAASIFGMLGIALFMLVIVGHMVSLRSVGIPYMAPAAPLSLSGMKDVLIRPLIHQITHRPAFLLTQNPRLLGKDTEQLLKKEHGQKGNNQDPSSGSSASKQSDSTEGES